jgi:hypothetical protein
MKIARHDCHQFLHTSKTYPSPRETAKEKQVQIRLDAFQRGLPGRDDDDCDEYKEGCVAQDLFRLRDELQDPACPQLWRELALHTTTYH